MHRATRTRRSLGLSSVANKSVSSVCMMGGVMKSITVAAHRIINQVDNIHLYFSRLLLAATRHRLRRGAELELECFRVEIIGSDTRGEVDSGNMFDNCGDTGLVICGGVAV